jgi:TonB family protein
MTSNPKHLVLVAVAAAVGLITVGSATGQAQRRMSSLVKGYICDVAEYPIPAMRKETQGIVRVRFAVAPDGAISDVEVVKTAGDSREHKLLDHVSRRQIESCRLADSAAPLEPRAYEVELRWFIQ